MSDTKSEEPLDFHQCDSDHLRDFLNKEIKFISKHLNQHKYLNGISDENEAVKDFIKKFGWLMRDMYCTEICDRKDCPIRPTIAETPEEAAARQARIFVIPAEDLE